MGEVQASPPVTHTHEYFELLANIEWIREHMNTTQTIWKFPLAVIDEQRISIPVEAQFLCVQIQNGIPCLWAKVNPNAQQAQRRIFTHGTGHYVYEDAKQYLGTYQLEDGMLIFHVFTT